MDKQIRSRLQKLVSNCRSLLDKEFTAQLQMIYGMQPTGRIDELSTLTHLDNEQYRIATLLRDSVNHLSGLSTSGKEASREAVQRLIREQAFTVLNRFAALKMCEEREITQECVKNGYQSKGFQLFLATCGSGIGDTYQRFVVFIKSIFDELSLDLGVLFDRFSPFGLLFPRENALEKLFAELNTPELSDIWKEDETIGWVYQYFNSKEERQAMRKSSSAPRNSRELAVRNQFFTPRYVVQFLTDNTLGRIWYEMTRGDTELKVQCEYLVRRPQEVFLAEGENPPDMPEEDGDKSQEELLKEPEYIPYRKIKDPREIRMLDPACGSMHFGLYAFDLYETIYEEAWDRYHELLQDIRERIKEKQEFLSMVPELIIRHNIHGIDIDHRAVQIAGLSLWLRAQKSYQRLGIQPEDRPRITRSNVVCAEPMPGEKDYLEEFISRLKPAVLGDLVKDVWEKMQLAGEAGSLLKIEEELSGSIRKAREVWEKYKFEKGAYVEQDLFVKRKQLSLKEMIRFDIGDVDSVEEWDHMEALVLSALKEFAESASGNGGYNRKLFAEDAAQGFAFIDVCRKRYDVVLMNPPFGLGIRSSRNYLDQSYPHSGSSELYASFYSRVLDILSNKGKFGAISSRTGFFLYSLSSWRIETVINNSSIEYFADLGIGVLDQALNETSTYVVSKSKELKLTYFAMLNHYPQHEELLKEIWHQQVNKYPYYSKNCNDFKTLPDSPFCYWVSDSFLKKCFDMKRLGDDLSSVQMGLAPRDEFRFSRLWWEVHPKTIGINKEWVLYAKGGKLFKYYSDVDLVLNAGNNLKEIKANLNMKYPYLKGNLSWVLHPENNYFDEGITFNQRTEFLKAAILPKGCFFSVAGKAIFGKEISNIILLALINTAVQQYLVSLRKESFEMRAQFQEGDVERIPWPEFSKTSKDIITEKANQIMQIIRKYPSLDETDHIFKITSLRNENKNESTANDNRLVSEIESEINSIFLKELSLNNQDKEFLKNVIMEKYILKTKYNFYLETINDTISYIIGTIFCRWDIRIALKPSLAPKLADPFDPLPVCPPGMLVGTDGLPAESGGIVSEEWLKARPNAITLPPEGSVKNPTIPDSEYPIEVIWTWNGILVDDSSHRDDIIGRMRQCFQVIWQEKADSIEQEACKIMDINNLRDYFRRTSGLFADHLKRYSKSRRQAPIYWPLSTASGSYTIWINYPRLTEQTLYRCVNDYINPKLEHIAREIELLQREVEKSEAIKARQELEDLLNMQQEIRELKDELIRVTELPFKPNLNDGVLITASPLYKLFRLAKWRKDLTRCWESLEKGDYDWAHLAYSIWPDRVREKCRKDRSLAIAHDLEDICEVAPKTAKNKPKKANKKGEEQLGLI